MKFNTYSDRVNYFKNTHHSDKINPHRINHHALTIIEVKAKNTEKVFDILGDKLRTDIAMTAMAICSNSHHIFGASVAFCYTCIDTIGIAIKPNAFAHKSNGMSGLGIDKLKVSTNLSSYAATYFNTLSNNKGFDSVLCRVKNSDTKPMLLFGANIWNVPSVEDVFDYFLMIQNNNRDRVAKQLYHNLAPNHSHSGKKMDEIYAALNVGTSPFTKDAVIGHIITNNGANVKTAFNFGDDGGEKLIKKLPKLKGGRCSIVDPFYIGRGDFFTDVDTPIRIDSDGKVRAPYAAYYGSYVNDYGNNMCETVGVYYDGLDTIFGAVTLIDFKEKCAEFRKCTKKEVHAILQQLFFKHGICWDKKNNCFYKK